MDKKNTKTGLWAFLAVLVLSGLGAALFYEKGAEQKGAQAESAVVSYHDIEDLVSAQGTLEPKDYVDVGAQVSGQLKKLYVDIGDTVKAGDLLADLDPQVYETVLKGDEAKLGSLQAQLEQQKAQAEYDRLQFERAEKLIKSGAISKGDMEEKDKLLKISEAAIKSLQAQIAEVQASVDKDKVNLGYTKIYAPMDGIISDRKAREGQTLNANQTTPTIVQVANLDVMTVRTEIAEADVMRLSSDMDVVFTTMGDQEKKWSAKIRQILPTPEVVNDVVLYNALIDVQNTGRLLMNGMSVQVSFVVAKASHALTLPPKALGRVLRSGGQETGKFYQVSVKTATGVEQRKVRVGLMTRSLAQILEGLSEGDEVVVGTAADDKKKAGETKAGLPPGMGPRL